MVPGDVIEWVYEDSGQIVIIIEELWSMDMNKWVSIGSDLIHMLVSIDEKRICWMNEEGLFHICVDDIALRVLPLPTKHRIVPRKKL